MAEYNPREVTIHGKIVQDVGTIIPEQFVKEAVNATDYFIGYPLENDGWFDTGTNAPKPDALFYITGCKVYGGNMQVVRNSVGAIKWADRASVLF